MKELEYQKIFDIRSIPLKNDETDYCTKDACPT